MISQGIQGKSVDTLSLLAFLDMSLRPPNPPNPALPPKVPGPLRFHCWSFEDGTTTCVCCSSGFFSGHRESSAKTPKGLNHCRKHGLLLSSTCLLDPKIPEMKGVGCWRSPYSVTFLSRSSIRQGEQPLAWNPPGDAGH